MRICMQAYRVRSPYEIHHSKLRNNTAVTTPAPSPDAARVPQGLSPLSIKRTSLPKLLKVAAIHLALSITRDGFVARVLKTFETTQSQAKIARRGFSALCHGLVYIWCRFHRDAKVLDPVVA